MSPEMPDPDTDDGKKRELYSIIEQRHGVGSDPDAAISEARRMRLPQRSLEVIQASLQPKVRPTIVTDVPATEDRMGFHPTVRALADITLSSATETPLAIGIDGEWGTGKSSILRMVEEQARHLGFSCITLNAWALERTEQLVASVTNGIQEEIRKTGRRASGKISESLATFMAQALASLVPEMLGGDAVRGLLKTQLTSRRIAGDLDEVASIAGAQSAFADLVNLLLDGSTASGIPGNRRRLLVLIDDVDRALPDQIATILRNLKQVLEVPRCVFLMAMDKQLVASSIGNFYRDRNSIGAISVRTADSRVEIESDPSGIASDFGINYLEKLVQIWIPVPRLSREAALDYIHNLGAADEALAIVAWAPDREILNPRRLKRYLNTLSVTLQLLMGCTLPLGVDNAFALRALALRRDFPSIYNQLLAQGEPSGIRWPEAPASEITTQMRFQNYLKELTVTPSASLGEPLRDFDGFLRRFRLFEL